jgi:hypothetical protein
MRSMVEGAGIKHLMNTGRIHFSGLHLPPPPPSAAVPLPRHGVTEEEPALSLVL